MKSLAYSLTLSSLLASSVVIAEPIYTGIVEPLVPNYMPIAPQVDYNTLRLQQSQQQYYDLQNELARQQLQQTKPVPYPPHNPQLPWRP